VELYQSNNSIGLGIRDGLLTTGSMAAHGNRIFHAGVDAQLERKAFALSTEDALPYSTARALLMFGGHHVIRNDEATSLGVNLGRLAPATNLTFCGQPCSVLNASRALWPSSGHKRCV
jgi:hypothetical protein